MEITAGGVVFRKLDSEIVVLLIFDRFDHISLPKGHLEGQETTSEAALREIEEETGLLGTIVGEPLGVVRFPFRREGQILEKEVTYYLVQAQEGIATPQVEEIRGLGWYTLTEARNLQRTRGYSNNDQIFEKAASRLEKYGGSGLSIE